MKNIFKLIIYFNQPFSLRLITALMFVIHACACALGYLILGPSPHIDGAVLSVIILMDLVFVTALVLATEKNVAHILILAWIALIFFCIRLAVLFFFPLSAIDFLIDDAWTNEELFDGISFITLGCMAIFLGIFFSSRLFSNREFRIPFPCAPPSLYALTGYWAIAYLAAYYVRIHLGVTIFGSPENWGNRMGWVGIIFDTDVALMFTVAWGMIEWRKRGLKKLEILHLTALVTIWLIFALAIGSRGGGLRVLSWLFLAALACNPAFKLSLNRFLVITTVFIIVSIYSFQLGGASRASALGAADGTSAVDSYPIPSKDQLAEAVIDISERRKTYYQSELLNNLAAYARPIAKRLAVIDYPLIVITKPANQKVLDYYIRSWHPVKNFINNMVPGEIFKESMVNTSRVFTMAYRGVSLQAINEGFLSEPWTIWGMAWILAGYGGLVILFSVAFTLQAGYHLLGSGTDDVSKYVRCLYFIIPLNIGYHMFGVDHWLTAVMHFSLACVIAFLTMLSIDRGFRYAARLKTLRA